jgi:hypothetical protein
LVAATVRRGLVEADGHDRLATLIDESLDVRGVVRRALRLGEERRVALCLGILEALLGEVVEALVAETAVSNATHAVQFFEPAPPVDAEADALALSLAAALSDGAAALGADVAAPPPLEQAAKMKAAVAPSDSSRIELRNVVPPRTTARTMSGPAVFRRGGYAIRPTSSMTLGCPDE